MTIQASGANATISYWVQSDWGITPVSPTVYLLGAATAGVNLKGNLEKLTSKAITPVRGTADARGGNVTVSGDIPFELPLSGLGRLLHHALGTATTYAAVTVSAPLSNLDILYADATAPAGAGTLTVAAGVATWQANGDTAGAGVNIATPGRYTLASGTAGRGVTVQVTGTVADGTAAPTVSSTYKTHVIKRGALPVGLGFQIAYGDIGYYEVYDSCRISKLTLKIGNSGIVTGTLSIVGRAVTPATVSIGAPLALAHVPYVHHEAVFTDGGVTADISDLTLTVDNQLQTDTRVVGSRYIASAKEGRGDLTGSATYLFRDGTHAARALAETENAIDIRFAHGTSACRFALPRTKIFGDLGTGIQTEQGLFIQADMQGLVDAAEASDLVIYLTNTEQSV